MSELREQYQIDVQQCISLLNSMVVGGENHSESSEKILRKGYQSLSSLIQQNDQLESKLQAVKDSLMSDEEILKECTIHDEEGVFVDADLAYGIKIQRERTQKAIDNE